MPETTSSLYVGLMATLQQSLTAPDFLERRRQSVKDFTRQRRLPFVAVVLFLLNLVKRPLQDELDQFFNLESRAVVAQQAVTKSAFCQARKKLKAEAFIELNTVQVDYFYAHFAYETWYDSSEKTPIRQVGQGQRPTFAALEVVLWASTVEQDPLR